MQVGTTVGAGSAVVSRWVGGVAGLTYVQALDEHEALVARYESARIEAEEARRRAVVRLSEAAAKHTPERVESWIRTTYDYRGTVEPALVLDTREAMLRGATHELETEARRAEVRMDAAAGHVLRAYKRAALAEAATMLRRLGVA